LRRGGRGLRVVVAVAGLLDGRYAGYLEDGLARPTLHPLAAELFVGLKCLAAPGAIKFDDHRLPSPLDLPIAP
jgi:hypothetical protein